jgi:NAD(P)-dependent dehydrogenase (short-subunit alcohol dehydrogenase family)
MQGVNYSLAKKNILITGAACGLGLAIAPGYVLTEMNKKIFADESFVQRIENRTPASRWAAPEEIAAPVAFLMSEACSYINGQLIAIDGGMNAYLQSNEV